MRRITATVLALCICLALSVSALAAEIGVSGGSGNTPVSLTTTNGGLNGSEDDITPTRLNVIVPTTLPMAMSDDGNVVTATDCRIINNSYGAVRVRSVTITAAPGWHLTAYGDKSVLAGEKVDSNKLGFAMKLGGGAQVRTVNNDETQVLIHAPVKGCYMTGAGNQRGNYANIEYSAIVTPLSDAVRNTTVATVVFVIEWDSVDMQSYQ